MIRTKGQIFDVNEVPSEWIFTRYIPGLVSLTGQDEMIKSVFNPDDKTPSMSIYLWGNGKYRFNDFSTGIKGGPIDLVMEMRKIGYGPACDLIISDYRTYLAKGDVPVILFRKHAKYKPIAYPVRPWSMQDAHYWGQYGLSRGDCEGLGISSLESYTLSNGQHNMTVSGHHIYGYFTAQRELYKIYQPMVKDRKFMKIKSHVQGYDQLERKSPLLVITKGLKDVGVIKKMGWESIAPDSENSLLPKEVVDDIKSSYLDIITIFDSDSPGMLGMQRYKQEYGFPYISLDLEKDPSDSVKVHGLDRVAAELKTQITKILEHGNSKD